MYVCIRGVYVCVYVFTERGKKGRRYKGKGGGRQSGKELPLCSTKKKSNHPRYK
jgi:hypothetical protein